MEYFKIYTYLNLNIKFVEEERKWFFKRTEGSIIFNTYILDKVKSISKDDAVHFITCLVTCSVHYVSNMQESKMTVGHIDALEALKAPFRSEQVRDFLKNRIGYTQRENYRNLEIADVLERILEQ